MASLFVASAAYGAKPQVQWNTAYDFSAIKTFAWKESPASVSLKQADPFLDAHIRKSIESQLSSSGLTEVRSNPDVLVTYYGSTKTETRLQSDSYGYGWGTYGGIGWGYYGYGPGYRPVPPVSTTTRVVEYERGTLVVDIVDASSNELVWRGSVSDISVTNDVKKMQNNITKAIQKLVKQSERVRAKS